MKLYLLNLLLLSQLLIVASHNAFADDTVQQHESGRTILQTFSPAQRIVGGILIPAVIVIVANETLFKSSRGINLITIVGSILIVSTVASFFDSPTS